jgi:hypothetical protein
MKKFSWLKFNFEGVINHVFEYRSSRVKLSEFNFD